MFTCKCVQNVENKMTLSDTKLKSILNKPYTGLSELTHGDGLGVRISQKGTIAFQFRYRWNGKAQRMTIRRYPSLSPKDVRILVGELRDLYNKGIDPKKHN